MTETPPRKRAGRRPAAVGADARETIERVAREQFAEYGYESVSVRAIARAADVDPKLVHHYFGGKEALFASIVQLPIGPEHLLRELTRPLSDEETVGLRFARIVIDLHRNPVSRLTILSIIRAAAHEKHAAERIRSILTQRLLEPLARGLGVDNPELRASMIGSQVVGLTMARFVVKLPALSKADDEQLIEILGRTIDAALGPVNIRGDADVG